MAWTRDMWESMGTNSNFATNPWGAKPRTGGAGKDGTVRQTGYLNDNRFINSRLSQLSQNTAQQAANALGIKNVNSLNDVNSIFEYVNNTKKKKEEEVESAPNVDDPNTGSGKNEPNVNYNPDTLDVPGQNQESNIKPDTGPSGFDPNNISSFAGRADRFGMKDLMASFQSGYSQSDVMRHLNSLSAINGDSGGYLAGGALDQGLRETSMGQISTQFFDPKYAKFGSPQEAHARNTFGHADLLANRKAGFSDMEILNWLDNNQDKLNPNQRKGVSGGIYETLNALRPVEPKSLMVGGSNLGNAGYADAIKPNRSSAASSTRSSYGTSQFNRNNFGNKNKSGLSITGLNI